MNFIHYLSSIIKCQKKSNNTDISGIEISESCYIIVKFDVYCNNNYRVGFWPLVTISKLFSSLWSDIICVRLLYINLVALLLFSCLMMLIICRSISPLFKILTISGSIIISKACVRSMKHINSIAFSIICGRINIASTVEDLGIRRLQAEFYYNWMYLQNIICKKATSHLHFQFSYIWRDSVKILVCRF